MDGAVDEDVVGAAHVKTIHLVGVGAVGMTRAGIGGAGGVESMRDVFVVAIAPAAVGLAVHFYQLAGAPQVRPARVFRDHRRVRRAVAYLRNAPGLIHLEYAIEIHRNVAIAGRLQQRAVFVVGGIIGWRHGDLYAANSLGCRPQGPARSGRASKCLDGGPNNWLLLETDINVILAGDGGLLDIRQKKRRPALIDALGGDAEFDGDRFGGAGRRAGIDAARREIARRRLIILQAKADLLEIVLTLRTSRRFAHFLHGRQQQADQDGDDRDNDQQFDQSESGVQVFVHDGASR